MQLKLNLMLKSREMVLLYKSHRPQIVNSLKFKINSQTKMSKLLEQVELDAKAIEKELQRMD